VGKPKERDLLASGKYISAAKLHFPARENTYNTQKLSPQILPWKMCQIRTVVRTHPENNTLIFMPTGCCTDSNVRPFCSKEIPQTASKNVPTNTSIFVPFLLVVRTVRIRTVRPSTTEISQLLSHRKMTWEMCPKSLGKIS
jgi:hypothetical protein